MNNNIIIICSSSSSSSSTSIAIIYIMVSIMITSIIAGVPARPGGDGWRVRHRCDVQRCVRIRRSLAGTTVLVCYGMLCYVVLHHTYHIILHYSL